MPTKRKTTKKKSTRSSKKTSRRAAPRKSTATRRRTASKSRSASSRRQTGQPGGGSGQREEASGSGVYPASGPLPPENAPYHGMASWGQGERGASGYEDSGTSEPSSLGGKKDLVGTAGSGDEVRPIDENESREQGSQSPQKKQGSEKKPRESRRSPRQPGSNQQGMQR